MTFDEPLAAGALRWRCDPASLPFETTADVEPIAGIVGQPSAIEALRFGIECDAPGQNVFVRGLAGSGRMTLVARLLDELRPTCTARYDRCYVHNFTQPDRPRLVTLPAGKGRAFRRFVRELAAFVRDELREALDAEPVRARRQAVQDAAQERMAKVSEPFEQALKEAGLALVSLQVGRGTQTAIFPAVAGKAMAPEEYAQHHEQGEVSDEDWERYRANVDSFKKELDDVATEVGRIRREGERATEALVEEAARAMLSERARVVHTAFGGADVEAFLAELVDDAVDNVLTPPGPNEDDPTRLYGVNVVQQAEEGERSPVVIETTPSLVNLLGTVEREWSRRGPGASDYRMIRSGALLRADGGYLILDARDVLTEPGAWKVLVRTLRTSKLEIVPPDVGSPWWSPSVKPEPIAVRVRVVLVGDAGLYYVLDAHDPDFGDLFKVLADFDSHVDREPDGVRQYAGVVARIAREEHLLPFHRTAIAALAEHGARIASRGGKLTARFARIADIAREGAFLANKSGAQNVSGDDVRAAVLRTRQRADLPSRRFQSLLRDGTILVQTQGRVVGQVNGLAVIQAGPLTYGFPARITATIGAGHAGIIDIEGKASLSGSIHTKGFQILGGCLRSLLRSDHALSFSASLAFEQSYGGIDGDSASGAQMVCLLSALTNVPLRQDLAITGALDQFGRIQAIGGVNEKIEGFFEACKNQGLTGTQGVLVPRSNADELMLRDEVVAACAEGRFHVYAVGHVREALELFTGVKAGERGEDGDYPEGTLLALAVERASEYWVRTLQQPVLVEDEELVPSAPEELEEAAEDVAQE